MDPLLAWRGEFPILSRTTYMISHSLGAMPRRAARRLAEFADTWETRGVRAWEEGWWEMPVTIGNLVGSIIGAGEGEVSMQPNVSVCQWIVASCFSWSGRRNKLVTDSLNFPSNQYVHHGLERQGARCITVEGPLDESLDAIDEETLLVSVSHVAFRNSYLQDLGAIVKRAHEAGALVVADLYQSAGTLPLDVRELGVDFATGGSVKWLCAGPGTAYLYVRAGLRAELQPAATGWVAHEDPFAFESGPIRYAADGFRFLNGTPNIPALYSARSGLEIIREIGVGAIHEKSVRQTTRLIELAREAGLRVDTPLDSARRGGVVTIDIPSGMEITRELERQEILVDYRPGAGIRISPHFYTADEEVDRTMAEIVRLRRAV